MEWHDVLKSAPNDERENIKQCITQALTEAAANTAKSIEKEDYIAAVISIQQWKHLDKLLENIREEC